MADAQIILTPALLAEWGAEKNRLEALVKRAQEDLLRASQRLHAATFLLNSGAVKADAVQRLHPADTGMAPGQILTEEVVEVPSNMTEEIEKIANSLERPISHDEMRKRLREMHFPENRLGNYYYTAVNRLKSKDRISVNKSKRIGRAPA